MKLASYGTSLDPADGVAFLERYILPSLRECAALEASGRILAGGPVCGSIALAFVIEAADAREVDGLVENLPIWPRMSTEVTPLTTFDDRAAALRPRLDRLRERHAERAAAGAPHRRNARRDCPPPRARPLADQTGSGA